MRVECYWNLHKHTFSIRALEGPDKGRVILHSDEATLANASFVVQKAGRERVLRERRKNVHAFVRGDYRCPWAFIMGTDSTTCLVSYNPYKADHFHRRDTGARVDAASLVTLAKPDGKPSIKAYLPK